MGVIGIIGVGFTPLKNQLTGGVTGTNGTGTGIVDIFNPNLNNGVFVDLPQDTPGTGTGAGSGTATGSGAGTNTNTPPPNVLMTEREQVIERVRTHPDLDPNAKIKILNLAKNRPSLTAADLRLMLAICLYPTAYGLPAPEGYEYFLKQMEAGETVAGAQTNAQVYFKADEAQSSPSDPTAPDSQDEAAKQGRIIIYALVAFGVLILVNR